MKLKILCSVLKENEYDCIERCIIQSLAKTFLLCPSVNWFYSHSA